MQMHAPEQTPTLNGSLSIGLATAARPPASLLAAVRVYLCVCVCLSASVCLTGVTSASVTQVQACACGQPAAAAKTLSGRAATWTAGQPSMRLAGRLGSARWEFFSPPAGRVGAGQPKAGAKGAAADAG